MGNTTLEEKETALRDEAKTSSSESPDLSVIIERAVSDLLEVVVRYCRTVFFVAFRPFKTATLLASEKERNLNRLSSPIVFLMISSFLSSVLMSFAFKTLQEETFLEYEEMGRLALNELIQGVKVTTSLTAILTATFPGVVTTTAAVSLICGYMSPEKRNLFTLRGVAYITIAFVGLLISISSVTLVNIFAVEIKMAIKAASGGGGKEAAALNILFWILILMTTASVFIYPPVLMGRAAEYLQPRRLFRAMAIRGRELLLPSLRLIMLPIILLFGVVAFFSGLASPYILTYVLDQQSQKIGKEYLDIVVVNNSIGPEELLAYVAIKNTRSSKLVFLKDSVKFEFETENNGITHFPLVESSSAEITSIFGTESAPIKFIKPGEMQWFVLRTKLPEGACNVPNIEFENGENIYYRVVVGNIYFEHKLFGMEEGDYPNGVESRSGKRLLCKFQRGQ